MKWLFPRWSAAEEGLRTLSGAPFPALPSHVPSWRPRASSLSPRGSPPGPWINAACVCTADVSLGHEHDFRVKHLSEALNDKHGPLAGEYRSPARGQLPLPWPRSPEGFALRMSQACLPLSLKSLFWALGLLASLQMGVCAWLSGPGPRGEAAATSRWLPGGQGALTSDSNNSSKALTRSPFLCLWDQVACGRPLPQPPLVGPGSPGAADQQEALPFWDSSPLLKV